MAGEFLWSMSDPEPGDFFQTGRWDRRKPYPHRRVFRIFTYLTVKIAIGRESRINSAMGLAGFLMDKN